MNSPTTSHQWLVELSRTSQLIRDAVNRRDADEMDLLMHARGQTIDAIVLCHQRDPVPQTAAQEALAEHLELLGLIERTKQAIELEMSQGSAKAKAVRAYTHAP